MIIQKLMINITRYKKYKVLFSYAFNAHLKKIEIYENCC